MSKSIDFELDSSLLGDMAVLDEAGCDKIMRECSIGISNNREELDATLLEELLNDFQDRKRKTASTWYIQKAPPRPTLVESNTGMLSQKGWT